MELEKNADNVQNEQANVVSSNAEEVKQPIYNLVVRDKKNKAEIRYNLEEGKEIIVGANPESDIFLDDEFISFKHFSVKLIGNIIEVKDLNSKNGLYLLIDGTAQVTPGQTLLAGKTIFKFEAANG